MRRIRIRVPEDAPCRADRLLAAGLRDLSRRRIQTLLGDGSIRVDGRRIRKGEILPPGAEVVVEVADLPPFEPEADPPVPVLYEDASLLALDKPAGRPGHALTPQDRGTIANFLASRYPETGEASENPLEHGLVHRLDTDTSGVILAARTREAWTTLRRRFHDREIAKAYVALVVGGIGEAGEIDRAIEPHPRSRRRVRVVAAGRPGTAGARPGLTRYRSLARYPGHTLLEIDMPTGVMHQIRAHLASIGHPIAGDALYGAPPDERVSRHLLHAASITFRHPASDESLRIESPLPDDFLAALAKLA